MMLDAADGLEGGELCGREGVYVRTFCLTVFAQERWIADDAVELCLHVRRQTQRKREIVGDEVGFED